MSASKQGALIMDPNKALQHNFLSFDICHKSGLRLREIKQHLLRRGVRYLSEGIEGGCRGVYILQWFE